MSVDQWEVMFWNKYNEAHLFGNTSVLEFETEEEANNFAEHAHVEDCAAVTFMHRVGNAVTEEYERKRVTEASASGNAGSREQHRRKGAVQCIAGQRNTRLIL